VAAYMMTVEWERDGAVFTDNKYSRAHIWRFDGGVVVPASSSPHVVRVPYSDPSGVDPEEAFVAALASCHLLTFVYIAARRGFVVDRYRDEAVGVMAKNEAGRLAMTRVTLRPHTIFSGNRLPSKEEVHGMHHEAHEACFIANSVRTEVVTEPSWEVLAGAAMASEAEGPTERAC
jgi:organic hydroperoxide reductase OsmC/OhrA